jgi:periplasmic protein TonB
MIAGSRNQLLIVAFAFFTTALALGKPQDQSTPASTQPQSQPELPKRVRVSSGVSAGLLLKRVNPVYPKTARKKHIQGVVIMSAMIDKNGDIANLVVVSGDPTLAKAATEAVQQWKYRPYLLQGQPVEVETQIQVNFTLAGS